jgi:hypothetical protein
MLFYVTSLSETSPRHGEVAVQDTSYDEKFDHETVPVYCLSLKMAPYRQQTGTT